jgi:hypothetical protein
MKGLENYIAPEMDIVYFEVKDVLTGTGDGDTYGDTYDENYNENEVTFQ